MHWEKISYAVFPEAEKYPSFKFCLPNVDNLGPIG
jgi:hypothetical protein